MNQQQDNTLVLFVNEYKTTDKHPDYKGKATVDGKEYKCAAWKQVGRQTGKTYLSVKLTPEIELDMPEVKKPKSQPHPDDDEIPF